MAVVFVLFAPTFSGTVREFPSHWYSFPSALRRPSPPFRKSARARLLPIMSRTQPLSPPLALSAPFQDFPPGSPSFFFRTATHPAYKTPSKSSSYDLPSDFPPWKLFFFDGFSSSSPFSYLEGQPPDFRRHFFHRCFPRCQFLSSPDTALASSFFCLDFPYSGSKYALLSAATSSPLFAAAPCALLNTVLSLLQVKATVLSKLPLDSSSLPFLPLAFFSDFDPSPWTFPFFLHKSYFGDRPPVTTFHFSP